MSLIPTMLSRSEFRQLHMSIYLRVKIRDTYTFTCFTFRTIHIIRIERKCIRSASLYFGYITTICAENGFFYNQSQWTVYMSVYSSDLMKGYESLENQSIRLAVKSPLSDTLQPCSSSLSPNWTWQRAHYSPPHRLIQCFFRVMNPAE